jgi:hypothetical protein
MNNPVGNTPDNPLEAFAAFEVGQQEEEQEEEEEEREPEGGTLDTDEEKPADETKDKQTENQQDDESSEDADKADGDEDNSQEISDYLTSELSLDLDNLTVEGLKEAINKKISSEKEQAVSKYTGLDGLADWISSGGDMSTFEQRPEKAEYKEIEDNDIDTQRLYVVSGIMELEKKDQEEAELIADLYKDKGLLKGKAEAYRSKYIALNDTEIKDYDTKLEGKKEDIRVQREQDWKEVESVLDKGFSSFNVDAKDLKDLKTFVSVDKNGKSNALEARKSLTVEEQLLVDLLVMKKFKGVTSLKGKTPAAAKKTVNVLSMLSGKNSKTKGEIIDSTGEGLSSMLKSIKNVGY